MGPRVFPAPGNPALAVAVAMRRWIAWIPVCGALALSACGGGGASTGSAESSPNGVVTRQPAPGQAAKAPAPLIPQPVSMVNTNTGGDQAGRTIGATADGGYTVVWQTGESLSMQHYDSDGHAAGPETALQFVPGTPRSWVPAITSGSVAVLEDGSVVLAYPTMRSYDAPNAPIITTAGLYLQRFGRDGAQILPETEVLTIREGDPRRPTTVDTVQVLAMPGGGYLLGWGTFQTSATVGSLNSFTTQFFDSQNQRVGAPMGLDVRGATNVRGRIVADGLGGYTLHWSGLRPDFQPTGLNVAHYNSTQSALNVLSAWPGSALLLPLDDGRYLLFTSDAAGSASSQFLDSSGAAQGPATGVPVMPVLASLLADGTYVEAWPADAGGLAAQRFEVPRTPIGDVLALPADATQRHLLTALEDGGFATAWSAAGAAGDLDVYTQSFLEAPTRKACLAGAHGLRGQERKAYMARCVPGKGLQ
jgi:hypothetical protein